MDAPNPIEAAIEQIGLAELARRIEVTPQRLDNWRKRGLPRTEWTRETEYATRIQKACGGKVKKKDLLAYRVAA